MMLRSINELQGYSIHAKEGEIGTLHEFYFDDKLWVVRYLVVDTGTWLTGKRVLISPASIREVNWTDQQILLNLTKSQVENSPDVDTEKPVSRQQEVEMSKYYGWPVYWGMSPASMGAYAQITAATGAEHSQTPEVQDDPHLRSANEVIGYYIHATDGDIGHVEDFLFEDETWTIRYMIVDTRNWWPGKKVLVSPQWISRVSWIDSLVYVDLSRDRIKQSPEFDPAALLNREYEERLHDHYGRPRYWS